MRLLLLLTTQLIVTLVDLTHPGGARSVIAETLLLKQHLLSAAVPVNAPHL